MAKRRGSERSQVTTWWQHGDATERLLGPVLEMFLLQRNLRWFQSLKEDGKSMKCKYFGCSKDDNRYLGFVCFLEQGAAYKPPLWCCQRQEVLKPPQATK